MFRAALLGALACGAALSGSPAMCGVAPNGPPVTVSAAISLSGALREIQEAYLSSGGDSVRFNFGASNMLARQIASGAPADLFISADDVQMDYAERAGAIDVTTRVALLGNRLAIVTRADTATLSTPRGLLARDVSRVAIGDPAAVPAGVYAKAYLQRAGIWEELQPKLLPLANVRSALAAVESGGADAAIVYESDVAAAERVRLAYVFTSAEGPPIVYPAAISAHARNREGARRFLQFLDGPQAREIFSRHNFSEPPK